MLTIWLENFTLKFQFLKLKHQFLKTQLGNYYCQISQKNNSNLYSANTPLSFKFEKRPMEAETLVCLETSQWKMNLRHMKRNGWETTHLKQESHTVFKTMQSVLKVITFWNFIFFSLMWNWPMFVLNCIWRLISFRNHHGWGLQTTWRTQCRKGLWLAQADLPPPPTSMDSLRIGTIASFGH